ncbi:unnamed protein product, partial [Polarella glacialis]
SITASVPHGYMHRAGLPPTLPVVPAAGMPMVTMAGPRHSSMYAPSFGSQSYVPPSTSQYMVQQRPSYTPRPAAPVTYAAPPAIRPSPSAASLAYHPASQAAAAAQAGAEASFRGDPPETMDGSFTRGFPDPASIDEQRVAYSRSLDMQLEHGQKSLQLQNEERKKQLHNAADSQRQALLLHMEQQVKMQEMALDEQTNQAMMGLKKAALDQRAALEQQA